MEYKVEFDVRLWTYVLRYNGKTYPLGVQEAREAFHRSELKLDYLKRQENGNSGNCII
jgi:hypothetical protein